MIIQEQSSRRELRFSEALVADFQKSLQQRDSELEALRAKITTLYIYICSLDFQALFLTHTNCSVTFDPERGREPGNRGYIFAADR